MSNLTKEEHARILAMLDATYGSGHRQQTVGLVLKMCFQKMRPLLYAMGRRSFDFVVSFLLLVMLSPVFLALVIIVRLDGGPAFYSQKRIGKYGREFKFWKFRSMVPDADKLKAQLASQNEMKGGVTFKMAKDPRITPIGRIIRRASIDELPQLYNVLCGHMSLVGPRPPLPDEVKKYTSEERRRLDTKQGITCTWQVSGRNEIPFDQQVAMDIAYIDSESLWNDIKLLLKTLPAVITGKGAT